MLFDLSQIVDGFFAIVNFIALCCFFSYYFKKSILPFINKEIAKKHAKQHALKLQASLLIEQQHTIDREIDSQAIFCEVLKKRVIEWRSMRREYHRQIDEQYHRNKEVLKKRSDQQAACRQKEFTRQAVQPQAVVRARQQLEKKFSDQQQGELFLTSMIHYMETGSHE